jgi:hypothetical protein
MEGTIDYSKHTEAELAEIFGRLDPRYALQECVRLGAITLQLPDDSAAAALVATLPNVRTAAFRPQIEANAEFAQRWVAPSPRTLMTCALIAGNILVSIAMLSSP